MKNVINQTFKAEKKSYNHPKTEVTGVTINSVLLAGSSEFKSGGGGDPLEAL